MPGRLPICHGPMRITASIDNADTVKNVLGHVGESAQPHRIARGRGPSLGEAATEQEGNDLQGDVSVKPAPNIEFNQRTAW